MMILALNPLSPTVAIAEIVILLLAAALLGYLLARWITRGRIQRLQEVLETKTAELNECEEQQKRLHTPDRN